jgi:hypothetical protein
MLKLKSTQPSPKRFFVPLNGAVRAISFRGCVQRAVPFKLAEAKRSNNGSRGGQIYAKSR